MKIFGEELGSPGRWTIALPPLLLVAFLVGLFFLAAAGQERLSRADERIHDSESRGQGLDDFLALITDAESEQRGYLLTGQRADLLAYAGSAARIQPALQQLGSAYPPGSAAAAEIGRLRTLAGLKTAELAAALDPSQHGPVGIAGGTAAPDLGRETTAKIRQSVAALQREEGAERIAANARAAADRQLSRWITTGGVLLNIGLVLLASWLVFGDMRRRARQAADLRDQKQDLARQVKEQTRELTALSTHLQGVSEQEKSALSRELHDELGGLLVAARMDLSWLQQRLPTSDPAIEQRFKRIHESLSAGVDLKRRVVEELRPTLLDNMGLYAALRWQFKESCRRAGLECSETLPDHEPRFAPDAAIGVFRVAQEALTNILKHANARSADLTVRISDGEFVLQITDDGIGVAAGRLEASQSHGIASMRHRISALGGSWDVRAGPAGGTRVTATMPLAAVLEIPAA
jgi:signal transduction histidine kinase